MKYNGEVRLYEYSKQEIILDGLRELCLKVESLSRTQLLVLKREILHNLTNTKIFFFFSPNKHFANDGHTDVHSVQTQMRAHLITDGLR